MATEPPPLPVDALRRDLLAFFDTHARDLPWRRTDDPYAIWVSEVMLQQTRVETVIPYFERWMARFPDVTALAAADRDEVLELWEGLGYYRRARALHQAAGVVRERPGARVPRTAAELRELPGVGAYTAGAVASIAFGEGTAAVDGNVRRVLSRLLDLPQPTAGELEALAGTLVDPDRPGDFNQALMELGATVCTPRDPACDDCPVATHCLALERGTVAARPGARAKRPVPRVEYGVAVLVTVAPAGGWRAALVRRPDDGMLAGLREFPAEERAHDEPPQDPAGRAARRHGIDTGPGVEMEPVPHAYSHLRATYHPVLFRLADPPPEERGGVEWMDRESLERVALPRAQRRIADALAARMAARMAGAADGVTGSA